MEETKNASVPSSSLVSLGDDTEKAVEILSGRVAIPADSLTDLQPKKESKKPTDQEQCLKILKKKGHEDASDHDKSSPAHHDQKKISKEEDQGGVVSELSLEKPSHSLEADTEEVKSPESKEKESAEKQRKQKKLVRVLSVCIDNFSDNAGASPPQVVLLKTCPSVGVNLNNLDSTNTTPPVIKMVAAADNGAMMEEAWKRLKRSYVYYKGKPVGTLAAMDPMLRL